MWTSNGILDLHSYVDGLQGQFAHSEQIIVANEATCVNARDSSLGIIKSDLAICSDPSLDRNCIRGYDNESSNCGYRYETLEDLCVYC